jgi:hypothetical protein
MLRQNPLLSPQVLRYGIRLLAWDNSIIRSFSWRKLILTAGVSMRAFFATFIVILLTFVLPQNSIAQQMERLASIGDTAKKVFVDEEKLYVISDDAVRVYALNQISYGHELATFENSKTAGQIFAIAGGLIYRKKEVLTAYNVANPETPIWSADQGFMNFAATRDYLAIVNDSVLKVYRIVNRQIELISTTGLDFQGNSNLRLVADTLTLTAKANCQSTRAQSKWFEFSLGTAVTLTRQTVLDDCVNMAIESREGYLLFKDNWIWLNDKISGETTSVLGIDDDFSYSNVVERDSRYLLYGFRGSKVVGIENGQLVLKAELPSLTSVALDTANKFYTAKYPGTVEVADGLLENLRTLGSLRSTLHPEVLAAVDNFVVTSNSESWISLEYHDGKIAIRHQLMRPTGELLPCGYAMPPKVAVSGTKVAIYECSKLSVLDLRAGELILLDEMPIDNANSIAMNGNFIYLSSGDYETNSPRYLNTYQLDETSHLRLVGQQNLFIQNLHLDANRMFGMRYDSLGTNTFVVEVDLSNSATPVPLSDIELPGRMRDLKVRGEYIYGIFQEGGDEFNPDSHLATFRRIGNSSQRLSVIDTKNMHVNLMDDKLVCWGNDFGQSHPAQFYGLAYPQQPVLIGYAGSSSKGATLIGSNFFLLEDSGRIDVYPSR